MRDKDPSDYKASDHKQEVQAEEEPLIFVQATLPFGEYYAIKDQSH
jgi:hypothetical protein